MALITISYNPNERQYLTFTKREKILFHMHSEFIAKVTAPKKPPKKKKKTQKTTRELKRRNAIRFVFF